MASIAIVRDEVDHFSHTTNLREIPAEASLSVEEYTAHLLTLVEPLSVNCASASEPGCRSPLEAADLTFAATSREALSLRSPRIAVAEAGDRNPRSQDEAFLAISRGLANSIARDGGIPYVTVVEDQGSLSSWLDDAARCYDLVVIAGDLNSETEALKALILEDASGQIENVRLHPAPQQAWGIWPGGIPILVVPANLDSATISYEVLVRPLIDRMLGLREDQWQTAVAATGWLSMPGRLHVVPVRLRSDRHGRVLLARPAQEAGAGSLPVCSLERADGIVVIDEQLTEVVPGLRLPVRWLR